MNSTKRRSQVWPNRGENPQSSVFQRRFGRRGAFSRARRILCRMKIGGKGKLAGRGVPLLSMFSILFQLLSEPSGPTPQIVPRRPSPRRKRGLAITLFLVATAIPPLNCDWRLRRGIGVSSAIQLDDGCQLSVPTKCFCQFDLPWRLTIRRKKARARDDENHASCARGRPHSAD
jgi:hypothetical protein